MKSGESRWGGGVVIYQEGVWVMNQEGGCCWCVKRGVVMYQEGCSGHLQVFYGGVERLYVHPFHAVEEDHHAASST